MSNPEPTFNATSRLRALGSGGLNVVLVEPEIPPNTGNIARLCVATNSHLHLVHPLGFKVDEKSVRRAGLDYWHLLSVVEHESFTSFQASLREDARLFYFTGKASRSFLEVSYKSGDFLVFGKESTGLSEAIIAQAQDRLVAIPTLGPVRSLNLANCAALGVYEALRQIGALDATRLERL